MLPFSFLIEKKQQPEIVYETMNLSANPDNLYLLEQLAEQTDRAFIIYDIQTNAATYLSPAFEAIWELPRNNFGTDFSRLLATVWPDDRRHVLRNWHWYRFERRSYHKEFEFRIETPSGKIKWVCLKLYLVRTEANTFNLIGWGTDISDEKKYTNVMLKYTARKNAALEILSHDLAGFIGLIRNLADNSPQTDRPDLGQLNHNLGLIRQICQRSTNLIGDLVNHEFLESANVTLKKERRDVVAIVRDVISVYQSAQPGIEKNFSVIVSAPQIIVDIDDVKFMQVINNLVSNAIKFTPAGGEINISVEEKPESILFTVADTGVGIPENLHPELFNKFTPAARPGLRGEPSIGLGMSIIKSVVEMHKGLIWFNSQEGAGSSFFIEIPKE